MAGSLANEVYLDEVKVAEICGIKKQTLSVWRCKGTYSLPFVKVGRSVRYRMSDVEKFLADRTVTSTTAADSLDR